MRLTVTMLSLACNAVVLDSGCILKSARKL